LFMVLHGKSFFSLLCENLISIPVIGAMLLL